MVTLENSTTSLEKLRLNDDAGDTGTSSHPQHAATPPTATAGGVSRGGSAVFPKPSTPTANANASQPMNTEDQDNTQNGGMGGDASQQHGRQDMEGGDSDDETGGGTKRGSKSGRNLSLEDLQSQFGVGLKEAAARLGMLYDGLGCDGCDVK